MKQRIELNPMPLWMSLLFFGVPTVVGVLSLDVAMPALAHGGYL